MWSRRGQPRENSQSTRLPPIPADGEHCPLRVILTLFTVFFKSFRLGFEKGGLFFGQPFNCIL